MDAKTLDAIQTAFRTAGFGEITVTDGTTYATISATRRDARAVFHMESVDTASHQGGVTTGGPIGDLRRDDTLTLPSIPGTADLFANDETAAQIFGVPVGTYRAIASGGRK
jgi:hypothetical protein